MADVKLEQVIGDVSDAAWNGTDPNPTLIAIAKKQTTTAAAPVLAAGENHVGEVGGSSIIIKSTTAVQAAAYASGQCIGGKRTLTGAMRKSGGSGVLQSICILDKSGQKPTGHILVFDTDPVAATITDKTAFVASTNDVNVIARIPVTSADWGIPNTKAFAEKNGLGVVVQAVGSADLFSAFVADAAYTFTSTSDIQIAYGLLRD